MWKILQRTSYTTTVLVTLSDVQLNSYCNELDSCVQVQLTYAVSFVVFNVSFAVVSSSFMVTGFRRFEKSACQLSRLMTKPTKLHVRPAKTQFSLVSSQSDQNILCPHEENLDS